MKIKPGLLLQAMPIITAIINEKRLLPQVGRYLLARLYTQLIAESNIINEQRNTMITAYDTHEMIPDPDWRPKFMVEGKKLIQPPDEAPLIEGPNFSVPLEKLQEFNDTWKKIAEQEIEVQVEPISIQKLTFADGNGPIETHELVALVEAGLVVLE